MLTCTSQGGFGLWLGDKTVTPARELTGSTHWSLLLSVEGLCMCNDFLVASELRSTFLDVDCGSDLTADGSESAELTKALYLHFDFFFLFYWGFYLHFFLFKFFFTLLFLIAKAFVIIFTLYTIRIFTGGKIWLSVVGAVAVTSFQQNLPLLQSTCRCCVCFPSAPWTPPSSVISFTSR